MSKRQFAATVGAYLTGWLIARATFERIWQHYMTSSQDRARQKYIEDQAMAIVTELELRNDEVARHSEAISGEMDRLRRELANSRAALSVAHVELHQLREVPE